MKEIIIPALIKKNEMIKKIKENTNNYEDMVAELFKLQLEKDIKTVSEKYLTSILNFHFLRKLVRGSNDINYFDFYNSTDEFKFETPKKMTFSLLDFNLVNYDFTAEQKNDLIKKYYDIEGNNSWSVPNKSYYLSGFPISKWLSEQGIYISFGNSLKPDTEYFKYYNSNSNQEYIKINYEKSEIIVPCYIREIEVEVDEEKINTPIYKDFKNKIELYLKDNYSFDKITERINLLYSTLKENEFAYISDTEIPLIQMNIFDIYSDIGFIKKDCEGSTLEDFNQILRESWILKYLKTTSKHFKSLKNSFKKYGYFLSLDVTHSGNLTLFLSLKNYSKEEVSTMIVNKIDFKNLIKQKENEFTLLVENTKTKIISEFEDMVESGDFKEKFNKKLFEKFSVNEYSSFRNVKESFMPKKISEKIGLILPFSFGSTTNKFSLMFKTDIFIDFENVLFLKRYGIDLNDTLNLKVPSQSISRFYKGIDDYFNFEFNFKKINSKQYELYIKIDNEPNVKIMDIFEYFIDTLDSNYDISTFLSESVNLRTIGVAVENYFLKDSLSNNEINIPLTTFLLSEFENNEQVFGLAEVSERNENLNLKTIYEKELVCELNKLKSAALNRLNLFSLSILKSNYMLDIGKYLKSNEYSLKCTVTPITVEVENYFVTRSYTVDFNIEFSII